ncbi:hypothetical protein [Mucilaginibacter pineti]|uniref:hypothetical protein n=1 Tax=Mucilaginibacter pineti TaxID=1391627 RepID=UPI00115F97BB|nr:hypothetical protein [Mucilaginibacter pineti]
MRITIFLPEDLYFSTKYPDIKKWGLLCVIANVIGTLGAFAQANDLELYEKPITAKISSAVFDKDRDVKFTYPLLIKIPLLTILYFTSLTDKERNWKPL